MTHVVTRSSLDPAPASARRWSLLVPAALTAVVVVGCLLLAGAPLVDIARYAVALLWAVVLPGTLVHRALRGRQPALIDDLALGSATGLALGLGAWLVVVGAGLSEWLWAWPLVVVVPFAAIPALRRHWRTGGYTDRGGSTAWLLALSVTVYTATVTATMRREPLPPSANNYYIDQYWHLANAAELSRRIPPEVPSVAGRTLRYHWFSNADVAGAHLVSGVDLPTVYLRLWPIAIVVVVLGLVVAVARACTGSGWPGGLASLLVAVPGSISLWSWYQPWDLYALPTGSPSQLYGLVPLLLATHVLIGLVRGQPVGGGWVVLAMAALVAPGSKPSVLPVLVAGTGLVLLLVLWRHRDRVRAVLLALVLLGGTTILLAPLVAQATAASSVKLFGLLAFVRGYTLVAPQSNQPGTGGLLIDGIGDPLGLVIAVTVVVTILLQLGFPLAGAPLLGRDRRADPALVLVAGCVLAAVGATLVIDHSGASEIYFAKTAVPLAAVLGTWGLHQAATQVPAERRRVLLSVSVGAVVVAAVAVGAGWLVGRRGGEAASRASHLWDLVAPMLTVVLVVGVAAVAWRWLRRRLPVLRGLGAVATSATVLAVFLVQAPFLLDAKLFPDHPPPPAVVTADETRAARWIASNAPQDAVLATNVHCREGRTQPGCDSRAFWVPALTERRSLVESWAYLEETLRRIGTVEGSFSRFPFDDQELLAENDAAFTRPTRAGLARLRDDHGVSLLYASRRAGPVSPRLADLATVRYSTDGATVYEIPATD